MNERGFFPTVETDEEKLAQKITAKNKPKQVKSRPRDFTSFLRHFDQISPKQE